MKNIFIIFLIFLTKNIYAAAPPIDDKPLPPTPYIMNDISNLSMSVKWDKATIKKFLPEKFWNEKNLYGGITVFNSKKKQAFSPLSGTYAWINIKNSREEESRLVFFSVFGKSELLYKVMTKTYSLDSLKGASKITLINNKITARTNIEGKNAINIQLSISEDCKKENGLFTFINYKNKNKESISKIGWESSTVCKADLISTKFKSPIEKIKISEVLGIKFMKNLKLNYQAPSITND